MDKNINKKIIILFSFFLISDLHAIIQPPCPIGCEEIQKLRSYLDEVRNDPRILKKDSVPRICELLDKVFDIELTEINPKTGQAVIHQLAPYLGDLHALGLLNDDKLLLVKTQKPDMHSGSTAFGILFSIVLRNQCVVLNVRNFILDVIGKKPELYHSSIDSKTIMQKLDDAIQRPKFGVTKKLKELRELMTEEHDKNSAKCSYCLNAFYAGFSIQKD